MKNNIDKFLEKTYVYYEHLTAESDEDNIAFETGEEDPGEARVESNWPIHQGFLAITLEDVALEQCRDRLEQWLDFFTPSTQPRSEAEHFYVNLMAHAIRDKLWSFN